MSGQEGVDALSPVGLVRVRFLVVPRVLAAIAGVLFVAMIMIVAGLFGCLAVMMSLGYPPVTFFNQLVGAVTHHVFTLGVMGLITPAMMLRIAKGHTGRPVEFSAVDKGVVWLMFAALAARVLGPTLAPAWYSGWVATSAACWGLAFTGLGATIAPMVVAARVDGRVH